ncbi:MAG TPA: hypothetical protein VFJ96_05075 [Gemmatimonadaceae bacterium]|jgi:hypothetical protein|nr:hypothetical protein [Gemmatimonadaceae bacterium]
MDNQIGVTYTGDHTRTAVEASSTGEAIAGAAAVVLGILGLIGLLPGVLASIACIAAGAGLLLAGGAIAGRFSRIANNIEPNRPRQEVTGSLGMEALAGAAGVVLGILALLGVGTIALLSIAAIVLGAGLIMAGGARSRLETFSHQRNLVTGEGRAMEDVVYVSSGSDILIGVGTIVLGILALSGIAPLTLNLISMLAIGAAILLGGSTIAARVFSHFG